MPMNDETETSVSEQQKRHNLASELADMLLRQQAIVAYNPIIEGLLPAEQHEAMQQMAQEDEKNYRLVETVATNFGQRSAPKEFTRRFTELMTDIMTSGDNSDLERLGAYYLLKQNQLVCGHLVHKAAQISKFDVKEAVAMLLGVQSTMEKQMLQVTALLEKVGIELITGDAPEQGMMGRAFDAIASAAGTVLSKVGKPAHDMSVLNVLRFDHRRTMTLLREVQHAEDSSQAADLLEQLQTDLDAHTRAEEEVVYAHFRQFDDLRQRLTDSQQEHQEIRDQLQAISQSEAGSEDFKVLTEALKRLVKHHIDEEEDELFKQFSAKADQAELVRLAALFMEAKQTIQLTDQDIDRADLSA